MKKGIGKWSFMNWCLVAMIFILIYTSCSSVKDEDEQLFIYIDQEFNYVSDVSLLNGKVYLIIDDSLLYYAAIGEPAIFLCSYPNMNFIGMNKDQITLDSALYKIIEKENDVTIEFVGREEAIDLALNQAKYGQQNEDYHIVDCCYGEWGGTVSYISKLDTSDVYSVESTCLMKILYAQEYHYLINYLGHGFGSSSIYQIRSIPDLPSSPTCYQFGFDIDNWSYQNSTMQRIVKGGINSLYLDTMGIKIMDARVFKNELYVATKNNFTDAMAVSVVHDKQLQNIYIDSLLHDQTHISSDSYITENGEVVNLSTFWDYEEVKIGIGYANEVKVYNIETGSTIKARVISQSSNIAPSSSRR